MSIINQFYDALRRNLPLTDIVSEDITLYACEPMNKLHGIDAIKEHYWNVLSQSLDNLERRPFIEFDSIDNNHKWIAATGYFIGDFVNDLLGIPATKKPVYLRFTEMLQLQNEKIINYYIIIDFLDVMNQAGVNPLRKSLGHDGLMMPPSTMDGLNPVESYVDQNQQSEQLVLSMLEELGRFDGKSLVSMQLENYWHPDFMWYGPAGIGTTRGISDFRKNHQGPFVFSFPDRVVDHKAAIIKKGNYVSTGGWPHMHGTHLTGGWLGLPPSGIKLELRVIDIWRRENHLLKENWVGIDIIHMCKQMGLDVFAMMKDAYHLR
ncbi:ester cyclase [uncultured Paraglaciecola sp.]|jgi:predicted ester cyclase|uniref:nuclear transport factor 2 family protein n=1 Tax=uncultured Paraglaciecola sp. TaxID=1765024 RepID=UPI0025F25E10|nr:ester cyclase [uncultured Paraglaciecola sp.]